MLQQEEIQFKVRVNCTTFNHASYIEDTLNGFTMQQTTFPFVCTIFDDYSTDGEQEIITKYLKDFFDFDDLSVAREKETDDYTMVFVRHKTNKNCYFVVVFLKYNHYSIRKPKPPYVLEWNNTPYYAICEGDDYWIDPYKLQKQVDIMEADESISMCYTRSKCFSESRNQFTLVRSIDCIDFRTFLLYDETITLTVLIKNDLCKRYSKEINPLSRGWLMGDTPLWLFLCKNGKIKVLEDITAVYTAHQGSVSRSGTYLQHKKFNRSALDIRLFFIERYDDCKDLIPYLYDKYYRANMSDAYDFGEMTETIKNFYKIKKKKKNDYFVMIKLLPKVISRKIMVQK